MRSDRAVLRCLSYFLFLWYHRQAPKLHASVEVAYTMPSRCRYCPPRHCINLPKSPPAPNPEDIGTPRSGKTPTTPGELRGGTSLLFRRSVSPDQAYPAHKFGQTRHFHGLCLLPKGFPAHSQYGGQRWRHDDHKPQLRHVSAGLK